MAIGSVVESLNTDTDDLIKTTILNMFNEILDEEYNYIDNFTNISSASKDYFYTNINYYSSYSILKDLLTQGNFTNYTKLFRTT